jgi:hypothetical protein
MLDKSPPSNKEENMPGIVEFITDAADDAGLAQSIFDKMSQSPDNDALLTYFHTKGYHDVTEAECNRILSFGSDILAGNRDY